MVSNLHKFGENKFSKNKILIIRINKHSIKFQDIINMNVNTMSRRICEMDNMHV